MAPSEGPSGDPAAEEGPTGVTRSSRSGPTTTRYFGDKPAAATRAGECDADGVEEEEAVVRRGYYPNPAPRRSTPVAGEGGSRLLGKRQAEAVPRCGCYGDTPPRRPRPFGEGTSAAGAEEAVLTCGCYRDTPPRRLVGANSTRLGHRCIPTLVRPGSDPTPCAQNQMASRGGRGQRDSYFYDGTSGPRASEPHASTADLHAKIGSEIDAAFCIPVVAGGRGDGGGRGDRDGYIYGCTARPHTFMPAPTSDLAPKDKATSQTTECIEEGYLAKIVPANAPEPKAPKANAVQLSSVKSANPDGRILKADIEDYSASVAKGGKCESFAASGLDCTSFAASGLDCTDIPNVQIRKVTANCLLASKQTIPQYYLTVETRADELIKLRGELNPLQEASGGKKISKDLVIKDADQKRHGTLGEEVKQLAQRARDNSLKPQDYEGGTFTQSNLGGPSGIRRFPAILNPPQPAILAIGSASVARGGKCESFAASGLDCTDIPNAQIRKVTANCPLASKQTVPQYYLTVETRADELIKLRGELNPLQEASGGKKISINDLVIKNDKTLPAETRDKFIKFGLVDNVKNDKTLPAETRDKFIKFGPVDTVKDFGLNVKSMLGEIDSSELPEFIDGSFICSDKGGCLGSNKRTLKDNYITKMDFYLKAQSMSEDMKLVSFGEEANNYSLRFEELKGKQGVAIHFCTSPLSTYDESESEKKGYFCALCGSYKNMKKRRDETQLFVDFCGSSMSLQKNLNTSNVNMLMEAAYARAGVKSNDCYPIFCGKVLEPEQLLSYYHIKRDSTIRVNPRIRGGKLQTIDFQTWNDKINACDRYYTVTLPPDLLTPFNRINSINSVKYLSKQLRYWSRQVLIGLCRKHFSDISFDGDFTSDQLLFEDGNFRFDNSVPIQQYNRASALLDYAKISSIFREAFRAANGLYPMHSFHLLDFLSHPPQRADPQSEAVTAFLCNHYCLLSYSERIKVSNILDTLLRMLQGADYRNFANSIGATVWIQTIRSIPAMKDIYTFDARYDKNNRIAKVPYFNTSISLLHFSNNFFKHADYSPEQLEAAFSLVKRSFIPNVLRDSVIGFMYRVTPCPLTVQKFIDEVITMLGEVTVGCVKTTFAS